jgi:hypothetical protein
MSIEEQGKRGEEVINVIQNLRNQEEWMQKEELKEEIYLCALCLYLSLQSLCQVSKSKRLWSRRKRKTAGKNPPPKSVA